MTKKKRFTLRDPKVDSDMGCEEIADDGQWITYGEIVDLLNENEELHYENNDLNLVAFDLLVSIERNVIIIEKIMREIDYIGRCNFEHNEEFRNMREEQFLIAIQNYYDKLFEDTYKNIRDAKKELKE